MKKINFIVTLAILLCAFVSCDKIEGPYITPDDSVETNVEFPDIDPATVFRKVLIEEYMMSRTEARDALDMDEYRKSMDGIYSTSVCESTIDEAPMAYKPIEDIIGPIADSVDIIDVMRPVYNFKAS